MRFFDSAVVMFNLTINGLNMLGISLTIAGGAYYSYVEYRSKQVRCNGSIAISSGGIVSSASDPPQITHNIYYEKKSPLPTASIHFFEDAQTANHNSNQSQQNQIQNQRQQHYNGNTEKNTYHRKTNSLAVFREFQYPRHQQ